MDRRQVLSLMALAGLAACAPSNTKGRSVETISYGDGASQFAELTRAQGASKGVVVVIHGGFWKSLYDLSLGRPLAASLARNGWDAYNLEYRRVGNGGGWPTTFDDVSAGIDALAGVDGLDTSTVITLGHSAGGHLAVLAAGRTNPTVPVTAAISQAGVLDLAAANEDDLGSSAVRAFMGDNTYAQADPMSQIPLSVPVRCVHGIEDDIVPISQSIGYVERAKKAGADAELIRVEGDHFVVIDPSSQAWLRTLKVLEAL
ncbi:acetyl esterase/lipase [Aeromicrobium panaciterrae]|uniref:Acetyl esterase/lipase n=1 Tax=Aeromicrobium panaciterrae TaxID=363861 RepID=A0ABU1UJD5_9ACTN|nr:alpha/beta hydrolase [Aeromicrobium panaciterrae]MDR7085282.1 acetyl esterase/lipase [Aeromicrobium panaciterrae]